MIFHRLIWNNTLAHMLEQPSEGFAAQIKTHALLFGQSGQL